MSHDRLRQPATSSRRLSVAPDRAGLCRTAPDRRTDLQRRFRCDRRPRTRTAPVSRFLVKYKIGALFSDARPRHEFPKFPSRGYLFTGVTFEEKVEPRARRCCAVARLTASADGPRHEPMDRHNCHDFLVDRLRAFMAQVGHRRRSWHEATRA